MVVSLKSVQAYLTGPGGKPRHAISEKITKGNVQTAMSPMCVLYNKGGGKPVGEPGGTASACE